MKIINKIILIITILILVLSQNIIYASMADYTDEQADQNMKKEQEEWKQEQEEKINKSSNNYLKELSVYGYEITPKFDKQTINYEIVQEINDDYLEIKAETDDGKASVLGIGKTQLNSGENNLRIDVTAENGTVRTYFIKVIKDVKKNIRLNSLKLKTEDSSIEITPEFDKDIFEYNCSIQSHIDQLEIEAIANEKSAKIEINGNENLKEGFNEIIILVYLEDNEKTLYKINVYKAKEQQYINQNNKITKIIVTIILVICLLLLTIVSIKKIKNSRHKGKS